MLGRFHEIGITTDDIRASVEFYESLGFTQAPTNDTWAHPYGVLTDGRLVIGLHQRTGPSPVLTFVLPDLQNRLPQLTQLGIGFSVCRTGAESFNQVSFEDPWGQAVTLLEARTYSPTDRVATQLSRCGYFEELSLPLPDFDAARAYWERLGFVALEELGSPYVHLPLTGDHLELAFHRPRTLDSVMLVFRDKHMAARIAQLREQGVTVSSELPRGLDKRHNALLVAPEGTLLALLQDD